jgi:hypothetical protein
MIIEVRRNLLMLLAWGFVFIYFVQMIIEVRRNLPCELPA